MFGSTDLAQDVPATLTVHLLCSYKAMWLLRCATRRLILRLSDYIARSRLALDAWHDQQSKMLLRMALAVPFLAIGITLKVKARHAISKAPDKFQTYRRLTSNGPFLCRDRHRSESIDQNAKNLWLTFGVKQYDSPTRNAARHQL